VTDAGLCEANYALHNYSADCLPANQKEIRMGRSIPVKIGKKEFKTKKAAVDYFMDQREAVKAVGPLKEGELFDGLRVLYLRYCEITDYPWATGRFMHSA
jgi:hypothetical protein